jgi:outer membrane lipoprotein LolB
MMWPVLPTMFGRLSVRSSICGALAVLVLQACTSMSLPSIKSQVFAVQGRFSVQYGEESLSGLLNWQAAPDSDEILLSSPLGQGLASITRDAGGVALMRPGQEIITAENAEQLTEATLGFRLPLEGLRFWMQGKPDPARASRIKNSETGELEQISQDGWTIDYLQYRESRPRKINVKREDLQIRLVVDEWLQ